MEARAGCRLPHRDAALARDSQLAEGRRAAASDATCVNVTCRPLRCWPANSSIARHLSRFDSQCKVRPCKNETQQPRRVWLAIGVASCIRHSSERDPPQFMQVALDREHAEYLLARYRERLWLVLGTSLVLCALAGYL